MTRGKPVVLITRTASGAGRASPSGFSRRATLSTARRLERMSGIEAAVAWLK
jgi:hypothetical protein